MSIEEIGANAGLVWNALSESKQLTIKEVKKITKLKKDKELYSAIGWLAREEKILIIAEEDDLSIQLL